MPADNPLSLERNIAVVVQEAKKSLKQILSDSGTILYSSCDTLTPGRYYFLGLNPGGSDEGTDRIKQSLENLSKWKKNAYLDQSWRCQPGTHPLQQNFKVLFKELVKDPASVCASNLIFRRSVNERGAGGWQMAELCWPVHEVILGIVQPRVIITFGRLPFDFIQGKLNGTVADELPTKHRRWPWRYSVLPSGVKLVGLPHLSRYALRYDHDVIKTIKERVG